MKELIPLKQSHAFDAYEDELRRLFITLYQTMLAERASDVNCYAAPHLGGEKLLRQYLVSENMSNFNMQQVGNDKVKYLLKAWRYRNPKRGTHFLSLFIRMIWGNDFEILPLYQRKNAPYPTEVKTEEEVRENKENLNDYFLTSRLRVTLYGSSGYFSTDIAKSLNHLLPARLFVQEVSRNVLSESTIFWAATGWFESTIEQEIQDEIAVYEQSDQQQWGDGASIHSIIERDLKDV